MQAFRNSTKVIAVVFAVILLVWLLGEVSGLGDSMGASGARTVGKINGQTIDTRTYEARVRQVTDQQQRANPTALTLEDQEQIRNQVWEEFLATSILESQYRKHGLTVTQDEVAEAVKNNPPNDLQQAPEFQTDGKFDMGKYQRWLTRARPRHTSMQSASSTATFSSGTSCSASSPPMSCSPTRRSGSASATNTSRQRSPSRPYRAAERHSRQRRCRSRPEEVTAYYQRARRRSSSAPPRRT